MMISNAPVQTILSGVASEVTLPNGTKVNFDGAFQDESGNAYSGSVQVVMFHLEASNENISSLMPGMLYAEDQNGQEKALETYGMMNVELKGSAGQKLQIANGHTAQITVAIDNTQLATAPNSIPLWHFDEVNGYWKEVGSAQKVGNNYVGEVSHFSWWNYNFPQEMVVLTINLVDSNGNPISSASVGFSLGENYDLYNSSNNLGVVNLLVPANRVFALTIKPTYLCGTIIGSNQFGPLSVDTVTTLTVNLGDNTALITGNLLSCDNQPVTNGYVVVTRDDGYQFISYVTNGTFNFTAKYCSTNQNFNLKGVDYETATETIISNQIFTSPITNVGTITACNDISEYIKYQIDGGEFVYAYEIISAGPLSPLDGTGTGTELRVFGKLPSGESVKIEGEINTPGVYTTATYHYGISGPFGWISEFGSTPNTMTFNLINHGDLGEYIDMTFSGTYTNQTGTHTLNGVAHVIRNEY